MTDIHIDKTTGVWDIALTDGDIALTHTIDRVTEVGQRAVYTLLTWYGECVYDTTVGVPYLDLFFGQPGAVPGAVAYVTQLVTEVEGVDSLVEPPTFDLAPGRDLSITMTLQVGVDTLSIAATVTP